LSAVKDSVIAAFDHQDYPFDRVVEETLPHAGGGDRRPLFDMMLIGQTVEPRTTGEHAGLHRVRVTGRAQQVRRSLFDLKLEIVMQPDEVRGSLEYSTDLYSAASAERLAAEYCRLAALVLADPQVRIRDADLRVERDERLDAVGLNL
jgi:non-ribosomal peptide synthetase component F